jgi:hypothetical protein
VIPGGCVSKLKGVNLKVKLKLKLKLKCFEDVRKAYVFRRVVFQRVVFDRLPRVRDRRFRTEGYSRRFAESWSS